MTDTEHDYMDAALLQRIRELEADRDDWKTIAHALTQVLNRKDAELRAIRNAPTTHTEPAKEDGHAS